MTNPNPFVPKGSLLENQSQRRSRLKLAVFCVLVVSITGLTAMLIQGCKRTAPDTETDQNPPALDTNALPVADTNFPPANEVSNPPVEMPPTITNPPVMPVVPEPAPPTVAAPAPGGSEYTIVKGDTLSRVAKSNGVTLKALLAANPGVVPTRLKVGQKLVLPAGGEAAGTAASVSATGDSSGATYTVKSGDTLSKIARKHHTTVKAIQAENNLITTRIRVGQKLKIPSRGEAAPAAMAPAPAPAPISDTAPAPALPPVPAPAPAPGQ